jgi:hypothetical protein
MKGELPFLPPRGGRSSPETLYSTLLLLVAQDRSHHVAANARAGDHFGKPPEVQLIEDFVVEAVDVGGEVTGGAAGLVFPLADQAFVPAGNAQVRREGRHARSPIAHAKLNRTRWPNERPYIGVVSLPPRKRKRMMTAAPDSSMLR